MRRSQFCRRRVRLTLRVRRYYATVGLTVLHALEGVPLTQTLLGRVIRFDRRNLKSMICLKKRERETWLEFRRRQKRFVRRFLDKAGIMELGARLVSKQYSWAGHVTRLPQYHVASVWSRTGTIESWRLRQTIYSALDPANHTAWRHRSKGAKVHWETNLVRCLGDQWRTSALNRDDWKANRPTYIQNVFDALFGKGARPFGLKVTESVPAASVS